MRRPRTIIDKQRRQQRHTSSVNRPNAWMFVDETADNDGRYVGASAVLLTSSGQRSLKVSTQAFREKLPAIGIPKNIEIHAAVWVQEPQRFPDTTSFSRINALGRYLRLVSKCRDISIINILADTSVTIAGTDIRERIWETLFWEFEVWLAERGLNGHVIFDKDRVGQVIAISERLKPYSLKRQPFKPEPADSEHHDELQLADVCAYFTLQRTVPNSQVRKANAANYIDRIAKLCPHPTNVGEALIRDLK